MSTFEKVKTISDAFEAGALDVRVDPTDIVSLAATDLRPAIFFDADGLPALRVAGGDLVRAAESAELGVVPRKTAGRWFIDSTHATMTNSYPTLTYMTRLNKLGGGGTATIVSSSGHDAASGPGCRTVSVTFVGVVGGVLTRGTLVVALNGTTAVTLPPGVEVIEEIRPLTRGNDHGCPAGNVGIFIEGIAVSGITAQYPVNRTMARAVLPGETVQLQRLSFQAVPAVLLELIVQEEADGDWEPRRIWIGAVGGGQTVHNLTHLPTIEGPRIVWYRVFGGTPVTIMTLSLDGVLV